MVCNFETFLRHQMLNYKKYLVEFINLPAAYITVLRSAIQTAHANASQIQGASFIFHLKQKKRRKTNVKNVSQTKKKTGTKT